MDAPSLAALPWYRHFWPWFILGLLTTSVVAGLSTVVLAVLNADSLVDDDYYKEGVAINRRFELDVAAEILRLDAGLAIDEASGRIELRMKGHGLADLDRVSLAMSHATQAARDQRLLLVRDAAGVYRGEAQGADRALRGYWYATLRPASARSQDDDRLDWRLMRRIHLPTTDVIRFEARGGRAGADGPR